MSIVKYILSVHFLLYFAMHSVAQNFYIKNFRAADGLSADLTKCTIQDKKGFIWIGTDNGLVRYDGYSFERFDSATASGYIKYLQYDQDSTIIVTHDLGLSRISYDNNVRPVFTTILAGQRSKTDTSLWYPKKTYRDLMGNIWIAEPQSVVRYNGKTLVRFDFGAEENSTSFVESFNFIELNGDTLLISSFPGSIFAYCYSSQSISKLSSNPEVSEIHTLERVDQQIVVGARTGLFRLDEKSFKTEPLIAGGTFLDIKKLKDNTILACVENQNVYILEKNADGISIAKPQINNARANHIFEATDGTVWISSERGLLQLSRLQLQKLDGVESFMEAVVPSNYDSSIYLLSKEDIWKYNTTNNELKKIVSSHESYFLTGVTTREALWVGSNFDLFQIKNDRIVNRFDLSPYGRFVFEVARDPNGDLWISQESGTGLLRFDVDNFEIEQLNAEDSLDVEVTTFECNSDGIYVSSLDPNRYLLYKKHDEKYFRNLSLPLPPELTGDFAIGDIVVVDSALYLATNLGLYRQKDDSLKFVAFNPDYDRSAISSLMHDGKYLWFGNTYGLFQMDLQSGDYAYFNEKSGLPINGINEEGIQKFGGTIWLGTSAGVGLLSEDHLYSQQIRPPSIISFSSGNDEFSTQKIGKLPNGSLINIQFSSLTYPSDRVYYSYRLNEMSERWSTPNTKNELTFNDLPSGNYTLEIRSKKLGTISWSKPTTIDFTVARSFYQSTGFLLLLLLAVVLLILVTRSLTAYLHRNRQRSLEILVDERTKELNTYKDNLENLVQQRTTELQKTVKQLQEAQSQLVQTEKMASLGILSAGVAHEINNPLNFIKGSLIKIKEEVPQDQDMVRYIEILEQGVTRISDIVRSLSNFSHKGTESDEDCDIHEILENCLMILKNRLKYKVDLIQDYCKDKFTVKGNAGALHQVFINLLSNAEQAIEKSGVIKIKTRLEDDYLRVDIEDNGSGIDEENITKITDPFFTTKPQGQGTGLGLHITYDIIRKHNGSIDLVSKVGQGTTFTLKLPASVL